MTGNAAHCWEVKHAAEYPGMQNFFLEAVRGSHGRPQLSTCCCRVILVGVEIEMC